MYFSTKQSPLRTQDSVKEYCMEIAKSNGNLQSVSNFYCNKYFKINGVKGLSILVFIPFFYIIKNCCIDSMHCLWEGVVKQFCSLWFDSKNHSMEWYIGKPETIGMYKFINLKHLVCINNRLKGIKTPHNSRKPLPIDKRSSWKGFSILFYIHLYLLAIDYKDWALYYSLYAVKSNLTSIHT